MMMMKLVIQEEFQIKPSNDNILDIFSKTQELMTEQYVFKEKKEIYVIFSSSKSFNRKDFIPQYK